MDNSWLMHCNIRSIKYKIAELHAHLFTLPYKVDIICISEHWLSKDNTSIVNNMDNFELVSAYSRDTPNGGTCILARKGVNVINRPDICRYAVERTFECSAIEVKCKKPLKALVVICVYSTPNSSKRDFLDRLEVVLGKLNHELKCKHIVICGDFNINGKICTTVSQDLKFILNCHGLKSLVNAPTHRSLNTETQIDYMITNYSMVTEQTDNLYLGLSDHTSQFTALPDRLLPIKPARNARRVRNFSLENKINFKTELGKINWDIVLEENTFQSVDIHFNKFLEVVMHTFERNFQLKIRKANPELKKSWLTKGIRISLANKREMAGRVKYSVDPAFKAYFKSYSKVLRAVIKASKKICNNRKIAKSDNKAKTTWEIIKKESGRYSSNHQVTEIVKDGKTIKNKQQMENNFNNFFLTEPSALAPPTSIQSATSKLVQFKTSTPATLFLTPTNKEEVASTILSLKSKSSHGWDQLSSTLLKFCWLELSHPLALLINISFSSGIFPEKLKYAVIKPLYKKGDPRLMENYRPIALVPVLSKIFEKVFLARVTSFLSKWNVINESQYGFQRGKSTESALLNFINAVLEALDGSQRAVGVFCDLSRAFDCVNHQLLLLKLQYYGIRGIALNWVESFLKGRKQKVNIIDTQDTSSQSSWLETRIGVPQGCILSPMLFLLYMNDLHCNAEQSQLCMYADDVSLLVTGETNDLVSSRLVAALEECRQWFEANGLLLNIKKTLAVDFCLSYRRDIYTYDIPITSSSTISTSAETKFLGITIDQTLSWGSHVQNLLKRLSRATYAINLLKDTCSTEILLDVYRGYFESLLRYGIAFWGASRHTDRVFKAQKNAIRRIFGLKWAESCRNYFIQFGILTVHSIYIFTVVTMIFKQFHQLKKSNISQRDTRDSRLLLYPKHKTTKLEKGPYYSGIKLFNKLPQRLKQIESGSIFKRELGLFLKKNAFYSLNEYEHFKK